MSQTPPTPQRSVTAALTPLVPLTDPIASLRATLRGRYEFVRELGQGAYATVYLARDLKHDRKVAIKVLHADPNSELGELRFIGEIRMLARLQHPNILPLHDSGHVETLLYYVMPYVSGDTLRDKIQRERQIRIDTACSITRDIADALEYAHRHGIIHRDIKPENILLSAGHPIIADFGVARAIDVAGVRQLTRTEGQSPGTPAYMSPEQLLGDKPVDSRTDIYSLGCVLFEMLTGKQPFAGKEGFLKRFTESAANPSTIRPEVPPWLDEAVTRALRPDPNDRFQTASEFAAALRQSDSIAHAVDHHATAIAPAADVQPEQETVSARDWVRRIWAFARSNRLATTAIVAVTASAIAFASAANSPRLRAAFRFGAQLDSSRFVVLPMSARGADHNKLASTTSDGLYESLRSWSGITLVPDFRVDEAVRGAGQSQRHDLPAASAHRDPSPLGAGRDGRRDRGCREDVGEAAA